MKVHGISFSHTSLLLVLLLAPCVFARTASAQSVEAVVNEMKARYQQQTEAVDSYIIETNHYTSYHRKVQRGGEATYETQVEWGQGGHMFGGMDSPTTLQPGLSQLDSLAARATYDGTATVDGHETHVLSVDDPTAFYGTMASSTDAMQGPMKMYVDASRYVPLRIEAEVQVEQDGQTQVMQPQMAFREYRTTEGLTLPWVMEMTMANPNASMSPEEREQARQGLAEMEARMEEMSEEQREMMGGMMESQLERLRTMLEEGTINFTIEVQDVQVNVPIPDGVFGGGE